MSGAQRTLRRDNIDVGRPRDGESGGVKEGLTASCLGGKACGVALRGEYTLGDATCVWGGVGKSSLG